MYHNLDIDNVCAKSTPLHYELQFSCPIILKPNIIQLHLTPYN